MTAAFLAMGQDLYSGVTTPSVTARDIVIRKKPVDWGQWIDLAGRNGVKATFRRLRPNHPQYAQLRQLLQGYRALAINGGWQPVATGPTVKPGVADPRVVQIRRNLRARGYDGVERAADPSIHDADLVEAVEHFQERHGLAVDGWAGPNTIAAMNVPASERVRQLAVNLERWRWLPRNLGRRHVLVNQAGFELFLKDGPSHRRQSPRHRRQAVSQDADLLRRDRLRRVQPDLDDPRLHPRQGDAPEDPQEPAIPERQGLLALHVVGPQREARQPLRRRLVQGRPQALSPTAWCSGRGRGTRSAA